MRRAGGYEVEVDPRMPYEPLTHLVMFVRGVVVEDDVDLGIRYRNFNRPS